MAIPGQRQAPMNYFRTMLLLAVLTALFMAIGYAIVRQLAANAKLPMPRVYIIHTEQPNAFATGRNPNNAAVAASEGLLRMLSKEEVSGVLAHELAHVKNHDTLTMT